MQEPYSNRRILDPCQDRRYCGQEREKNQKDSGRKYCIAWRRDDFSEEVTKMLPHSSVCQEDERQQIEREMIQGIKKNFFTPRTARQKNWTAQGGCAVSILGGFQDPTGKSPEQLV